MDKQPDWSVYTTFVDTTLARITGIDEYSLIEKTTDLDAPFFMEADRHGCRRVSLWTDLEPVVELLGDGSYSISLTDPWRSAGTGYLDMLQVTLDSGLIISSYECVPPDSDDPHEFNPRSIAWRNEGTGAPATVRLIIHAAERRR